MELRLHLYIACNYVGASVCVCMHERVHTYACQFRHQLGTRGKQWIFPQ